MGSVRKALGAVVALVPSHVTFPSITLTGNTSSWTYNDRELTAIETPLKAVWRILLGDAQGGLKIILENEEDPTGLGEPLFPPVFAAVSNALYKTTGRRLYQQPFLDKLGNELGRA